MTEENALTIPQVAGQLATFSDEDFDLASKGGGGDFMGQLRLFGTKNDAVTTGDAPSKQWAKVKGDEITALGETVDVYVCDWRPKALDFSGKTAIVSYDAKSAEFERIKGLSANFGNDCMCGIEFLVYVPRIKEFLLYWATGSNAREDARKLRPLIRKTANLSGRMKVQGKYTNYVPVTKPAGGPIGDPPSDEALTAALTDFRNPRSDDADKAAEGERPR